VCVASDRESLLEGLRRLPAPVGILASPIPSAGGSEA
jgi:hypothetical protein